MSCPSTILMLSFDVVVFVLFKLDPFSEYLTDCRILSIWVVVVCLFAKAPEVIVTNFPACSIHQELFSTRVHWVGKTHVESTTIITGLMELILTSQGCLEIAAHFVEGVLVCSCRSNLKSCHEIRHSVTNVVLKVVPTITVEISIELFMPQAMLANKVLSCICALLFSSDALDLIEGVLSDFASHSIDSDHWFCSIETGSVNHDLLATCGVAC